MGYVGIAYTEAHAEKLYDHLGELMKKEMVNPASKLWNASYAKAVKSETNEEDAIDPKPKPKAKAKGKGKSKAKAKPKPKSKGKNTDENEDDEGFDDQEEAEAEPAEEDGQEDEELWDPEADL